MDYVALIQENAVLLVSGTVTLMFILGCIRLVRTKKHNVELDKTYDFMESLQAGAHVPDYVPERFACSTTKTFAKGKEVEDREYEHVKFNMGFKTKNNVVHEIWY